MCAANDRDVFPPPWFFKINICANHSQYCGRLVGAFLNTAGAFKYVKSLFRSTIKHFVAYLLGPHIDTF